MKYLKILSFIIFLFIIGHLFTEYTSLLSIILIPYCLLILIEYALFVRKNKKGVFKLPYFTNSLALIFYKNLANKLVIRSSINK